MGIEDLRRIEAQVQGLIAAGVSALAIAAEGQQIHAEAAQTCIDAAGQADMYRLHASRAFGVIANGAQLAYGLNQSLVESLRASNIPENETLTIRAAGEVAAALAKQIASLAKSGAASIDAQQEAPAVLQGAGGEISAAAAVGGNSTQHLQEAQAAAGRTIQGL